MKITITLKGHKEVLQRLHKRGVNLRDFSNELDQIGKYLVSFHKIDVFDSEGQIIGERWPELKDAYFHKKQIEYPGAGTLVRTGRLRNSFVYKSEKMRMLFRNTMKKYGPTHQFGDPKRGIPKRTFFKITEQVQRKMVDIIHEGFLKKVNQV